MKSITFNASEVLPIMTAVNTVTAANTSIPILSDIIIESRTGGNNQSMILSSSDGSIWISAKAPIVSGDDGFAIAVNAASLVSSLKNLHGRILSVSVEDESTVAKFSYESGYFELPIDNPSDFPKAVIGEAGTKHIVEQQVVAKAIGCTKIAVSKNELMPIMFGIHFDFLEDGMVAVALDNSKMVKYKNKSVLAEEGARDFFTIPLGAVYAIRGMIGKDEGMVSMSANDRCVVVSRSDFRIVATMADGKYPPYDMLLRSNYDKFATVCREDLVSAIKRVMPMSDFLTECVVISFSSDGITLRTDDVAASKSATDKIGCEYEGEDIEVCLKCSTVLSVLSILDCDNVRIKMTTNTKAVEIEPELFDGDDETTTVLMPMMPKI